MARKNHLGKKFGKLIVIDVAPSKIGGVQKNYWITRWLCKCECGMEKIIPTSALQSGRTLSCGCHRNAQLSKINYKHGESGINPEHSTYMGMLNRCYTKTGGSYKSYGGRGITVCDRWKDNYINFLEDMGRRPSKEHSIDRINVNGNYEPGNCRWATKKEQSNNCRKSIRIDFNNKTYTISELATQLNKDTAILYGRYYAGKIEQYLQKHIQLIK